MQSNQDLQDMPRIVAALGENNGEEGAGEVLPEEEGLHSYPITFGDIPGVVFTKQEVPEEYLTSSTVFNPQEQEPPTNPRSTIQKQPRLLLIPVIFSMLAL
jgi:hypothetical protein